MTVKILKNKELREMSTEELENYLNEARAELKKEKAQIASGTRPENPGRIRTLRRYIARILTILNERKEVHT
ncbi:MAG: 50S ribosomal protein L29 [Candidatus Diapherotrites archaeon]|nr:50S ribosomal protein L29 [Candidatus Diapherotrites archaeon]